MSGAEWEGLVVCLRALMFGSIVGLSMFSFGIGSPHVVAAAEVRATLSAYLDGVAIPLSDVSKYYCDDFSYPVITCSVSPIVQGARSTVQSLLASVDYVTVYDQAGYAGPSLNVSQDYGSLLSIGWNDRISSFKVRNSETGRFFVDWFYGGSGWSFCCNTLQPTLGGYDNTFSSIQRT
jgi:hypothetical protein